MVGSKEQDGWEGGAGSAARGESERATMMMALDWEILTIVDDLEDDEDNNDGAQSRDAITVLKEHTVDEDNDVAHCRSSRG